MLDNAIHKTALIHRLSGVADDYQGDYEEMCAAVWQAHTRDPHKLNDLLSRHYLACYTKPAGVMIVTARTAYAVIETMGNLLKSQLPHPQGDAASATL